MLQITQEADSARRTFYLNYNSKTEVLAEYTRYLYDDFVKQVGAVPDRTYNADVKAFFAFWDQHRDCLELLNRSGQFNILLDEFMKLLETSEDFSLAPLGFVSGEDLKGSYAIAMIAASLWIVLKKWTGGGMQDPGEKLAELFIWNRE